MIRRRCIPLTILGFVAALPGSAYHFFYLMNGSTALPQKWQTTGVVFTADSDGPSSPNFTTMSTTATTTWNSVADALDVFGTPVTSTVNFTHSNLNTEWGKLTGDGKHELVYDADGEALRALGYNPATTNGYGPSRGRIIGGQAVIDDAFFVVTGTRTNFDLQSTMVHELGHILGLAHSSVGMHNSGTAEAALDKIDFSSVPTMHPFSLGVGNTARRTLEADDRAGLRELYPEAGAASRWASITGQVRRCGTNVAVVGANVRAVHTSDSSVQVSRFSAYDANGNGQYAINYLPAGSYRIVVEPMGANDFFRGRFARSGAPPLAFEDDFDYEYLSPVSPESTCTEETPEPSSDIQMVTASTGATASGNDIRVGFPALAFVVDDTGSMSEEIASVRTILNATITTLQAASVVTGFPLTAIVTFKDNVTKRVVSNNPTSLRNVVNALVATGGGDCAEASNAAALVAGRMLKRGGVALLFTDADTRPDGPARGSVTDLYRSKGVRLFTLMSGTCTGSISATSLDEPDAPVPFDGSFPVNHGASNNDEFPLPATNGSEPGVTTFSNISNATGGFFVAIPGVNSGNTTEVSRYNNTGTNLSVSAVLPAVALATPTSIPRGARLNVEISASNTNFISGSTFLSIAGSGITVNSVTVVSPTRLIANLTVDPAAPTGFRDVTVTTSLGAGVTEAANGIGVLNVVAAPTSPTTISVTPSQAAQGQSVDVVINGAAVTFTAASVPSFGPGVTVVSKSLVDAQTLQVRIQVASDATVGYRRVSVTTGASVATDTSPSGGFQVAATSAGGSIIQSVSPGQLLRGTTATLTLSGINTTFGEGTAVTFSGSGITVNSVTVVSAVTLTVNVSVAADAALGFRDVTATTGSSPAAILNGVQVIAASTLGDVNGDGLVNCADLMLVITSFGKSVLQPGYDPRADVIADGVVDIKDLAFVARRLPVGATCF